MQEQITMSFVLTKQLQELLKQWAEEDDRTVSATLRQILEREAQRRTAEEQKQSQLSKVNN